jgi:SnoaL-like domain
MFRHHHSEEPLADRIDDLMTAVFIDGDRERLEKLAEHLAPDFVYISPQTVVEGAEGLSEAFSRFRRDEQLPATLHRTSSVDVHHAHFRYSWARSEGDEIAMEGWSFGWMDASGLVERIVSFDGLVPGGSS